jgi:hypothetical protein
VVSVQTPLTNDLAEQSLLNRPVLEGLLSGMPAKGPECSLEAMRRVLPELVKLGRYEQRAASRRNQAIRKIVELKDRG